MTVEVIRPNKLTCFLALPYREIEAVKSSVHEGVLSAGYRVLSMEQGTLKIGSTIQEAVSNQIARADCIIADISERNPNVYFEIGLAQAMGKGLLLISEESKLDNLPADIAQIRVITYTRNPKDLIFLQKEIARSLIDFRRFPRQKLIVTNYQSVQPFTIDWDNISETDTENLCKELLSQLGFRHIDWAKDFGPIDMVAYLPKKDPDGFSYREVWLISMGLRSDIGELISIASHEPEYLVNRLNRYSPSLNDSSIGTQGPLTLLIILLKKSPQIEDISLQRERLEKLRFGRNAEGYNIRFRIWDKSYLTSLVQRFPTVGYKYFSDEGRIRSQTRKSYEQLYHEYSDIFGELTKKNMELEEEKNKRIQAERDSVWKDISFSAAHKIGNPIFAIETELDPLLKRIRENRQSEAEEVVENIHSSVEKAKGFVEQFKSLARAQEINPEKMLLEPILLDSCNLIVNRGITCNVNCPPNITVNGDPDRLKECFDELVNNATYWFDKDKKTIDITAVKLNESPSFLDTTKKYVLIHVKDNGCGIPTSLKKRIFDAFFTKRDHGTGLGLALVRRIVEGHGGFIAETGTPGKGADFEIYLPTWNSKTAIRKTTIKKITSFGGKALKL